MCKKIFILFLILCLLTTLIGCRGVPTVPPISPEPEVSFSEEFVLVQVTDPESNIIFVTGKKNEDAIAILGEKNIAGEPTNITGTVYVSEQGDSFVIEAGIDGLPIHAIDSKGNKVIFENYTNSTVDLSIYNSNGDLIQGPTIINVDPADLLELKQLYNSFYSKQRWSRENTADVLKWGSLVIKWVSCGLSFYSGIVPVMAYVCGKAILSTIAAITPDDTDNVILMVVSTALCLFGDLTACVTGLLDVLAYGASMTETYTITASAGPHGSISPSGNVTVNHGSDKSFTITPVIGYSIDDVLVDGSSVGAVRSYTFTNVTENHTISATFLPVSIEGTTGKIAFASDRDGNNEIYVMNADGSNQTNLTNNPGSDIGSSWGPFILLGGMGYVNIDNDGVASNEQGYIGLSNPEKVIEFEDKAFESAIRDCFDLDDGDITWRDIGYRTALDSDDFQPKGRINTLEDLKWFVNLQKIEMQEYEVEGDLSSFSHMENLEVLLMWETDVSGDLSSLSGLENLRAINLSHTGVVGDLSSLSGLETIEEIELVGTAVKGDVSCFDGHENLEVLELEDTYVTGR